MNPIEMGTHDVGGKLYYLLCQNFQLIVLFLWHFFDSFMPFFCNTYTVNFPDFSKIYFKVEEY